MAFRPNWYGHERGRGAWRRAVGNWSGVRWVVTLTVGVFVLQFVEAQLLHSSWLADWGALRAWMPPSMDDLAAGRPHGGFNFLFPVQLVTYALLHASLFGHLFWNMLFLFFFGPDIEGQLGRSGFLRLYVGGAIAGGLLQWGWYLLEGLRPLVGLEPNIVAASGSVIGASGAVFTVMVLFALNWPHRQILIWGLLPVPIWAFVAFSVAGNVLGLIGGNEGSATSFLAHLGGAAFGLLWFKQGDLLQRAAQRRQQVSAGRALAAEDGDRREMDRILAKIQASGLGSLDGREREFLERRSRQLRNQGR